MGLPKCLIIRVDMLSLPCALLRLDSLLLSFHCHQ